MKKLFYFALSCGILFISACNSDSIDKNSYVANANEMLPWLNHEVIQEAKMNEHPYVFFVDTTHEFSYGFKAFKKDIKVKNAKKITVSCDGYLYQNPSKVQLVIDIKNNGHNIFWQSQLFDQQIKAASTWGKVKFSVDLPKELNENAEILVYVWSPSREVGLFDNLTVKFE